MSKMLIVASAVAAVLAVAVAVGLLVAARCGDANSATVATAPPQPADESTVEATPEPAAPRPPIDNAASPELQPQADAATETDEAAVADEAAMAAAQGLDLASLVDNLTEEQEKALYNVVRKRERARQAEAFKYLGTSDYVIGMADLKLSGSQEEKITEIRNALKPQMDVALGDIRSQMREWGLRHQELWKDKSPEDRHNPEFQAQAKALSDEYGEYVKEMQRLQEPFDQEYLDQVREVLTSEQQQTLDEARAAHNRRMEEMRAMWQTRSLGTWGAPGR